MVVIELIGLPASGKSTVTATLHREHGVRSTMWTLDHDVTRRSRAARRSVMAGRSLLRRPKWSALALVALFKSGQPRAAHALRLWPNVLVVADIVDRARSHDVDELFDQGPVQFVASAKADATRPALLDALLRPWLRPDLVIRLNVDTDLIRTRLSTRDGFSRADNVEDVDGFLARFETALETVPSPVAIVAPQDVPKIVAERISNRALRIDHVITWLDRGGAQRNTILSAEGQSAAGSDVRLVHGNKKGVIGNLRPAAGSDVSLHHVHALRQELAPLHDLRALGHLYMAFRRRRPDVVHTHSSKAGVIGRLAAKAAGVPAVVHTVHGWSFHDHQHRVEEAGYRMAERLAARATDAIVVLAENDRQKGREGRIGDSSQYHLIRSGIRLAPFRDAADRRELLGREVRTELGIDHGAPIVGSVTRLSDQKDPLTLLEAIAVLVNGDPRIRCIVIGDGPLLAEVERRRARLGLDEVVQLLGSRDDVPRLLTAMDVFLLTSRWEGLPRVVPEAMAAGVPIVATDVDGTGEIVRHERTGLLIPPEDPRRAAIAVDRVLESPLFAAELVDNAKEVVDDWEEQAMLDSLYRLYMLELGAVHRG